MMAQFPSKAIAKRSYDYRTLGLGLCKHRRFADEHGLWLRQRRRPRHVCRADRVDDRCFIRNIRRDGQRVGAVPRVQTQCTAHVARDAQPPNARVRQEGCVMKVWKSSQFHWITRTALISNLVGLAEAAWDEAVSLGEKHGYRNAQVSVIAPTGTIGLVMDCDTTGIEPDFALVKFKKLGRWRLLQDHQPIRSGRIGKIWVIGTAQARRSFPTQLVTAQWATRQTSTTQHWLATVSAKTSWTRSKRHLPTAFDIRFVFNQWTLGAEFCNGTLGIPANELNDPSFDLLSHLGFSQEAS